MKSLYIITLTLLLTVAGGAQSKMLRQPSLNFDGSQIAFSYHGDIWTVPSTGGKAARITVHEATEMLPRFSYDGKDIFFSSNRYGNFDLFAISAGGGTPRQLTYNSAPDFLSSVEKNGRILFTTVREFVQLEREQEIYALDNGLATEYRLMDEIGFEPAPSPDGKFIAFVRGSNQVQREAYSGAAQRDIWLYNTVNKIYSKLTSSPKNDILPQWGDNSTLYFLSAAKGKYNLYSQKIDAEGKPAGAPAQLTAFADYAVRYFSVSGDGKSIVMEQGADLFFMKSGGTPEKISVDASSDFKFDPVVSRTFAKEATEYAISPNGKLAALVVRGELFVKEADKEKTRSVNLSNHPFRDMNPVWLNDSTIIFTSDREDNNFDLYMVQPDDKDRPGIFRALKHKITRLTDTDEDESSPVISPDGKSIVYLLGAGNLLAASISASGKMSNEITLLKGWAEPSGVAFSPDSRYLAYSLTDLYFNDEIFIHEIKKDAAPVNVSMHPRGDRSPFWSADGSKLGFISERNNRSVDVWFAWLKKEDWEKTRTDWEERDAPAPKKEDKKSDSKDSAKVKPVKIDFENIYERLTQVTSFPGTEWNFVISRDGETFYFTATSSTAKGSDLYSIKWNGKDLKELTKGGTNPYALSTDKDVSSIYFFRMGGSLNKFDVKSEKQESLPYSMTMKVDFEKEKEQIFEEAWRAIRDGFYDPGFHGKDWDELKSLYKPLCMLASTSADFGYAFNYMLGELNSSHMGLSSNDRAETQKLTSGMTGAELFPVKNGMKVARVIPYSPASKETSRLNEGDIITSVNGTEYNTDLNFFSLLEGTVDKLLLLEVENEKGEKREVVLRPANDLRQLLYEEWVADRKKLTDKYSNGKLGYIHIQGMSMPSFEVFERELAAAGYGKEGIVIDVRFNGGGFTTDYLMLVLNYKQHAYTIPRGAAKDLEKEKMKFRQYYPTGERLPYAPWLKPSVALCNESSYSNAEIFSHAYKTLGIGTLVGVPTNGSVISTGAKGLMDGSMVRMPFRGWFTSATNVNQEVEGPAVPNIIVENSPGAKAKGTDEQLKAAVDELLKQINKTNK
ncbi:MAG: PD40 domain-containing protein [Ignavibacteriaceae bacterium]|nr:PD40 domain-containing protein [Ignavibacteriaceae bacterium]